MKPMTEFQKKVYEAVRQVPRGRIITYKKVAALTGHPRAWRAAGNILHRNRNPNVPCHRVIKSDGSIGGFYEGQEAKTRLLIREGIKVRHGKVVFYK